MAGAGDLKGKGTGREEDEGMAIQSPDINPTREPENKRRKREPAASTKLAGKLAGCTCEPADIAGAGDLKGTGEQDEGKAIQSPDINTTRETEKKREVAACTRHREPAASTEGDEVAPELAEKEQQQQQRKLIEQLVAERYTVPAEVFAAGCSSGCALVGSIKGFRQQAAATTHRPFYIMPYLPPRDAANIESKMKTTGLGPLLMNPDMLASKVAVMEDIDSEIRKVQLLLSQEDLPNPNPEEKEKLRFRDQEHRARAKVHRHRIASDLIRFRAHMHNRLLSAYAAKDEGHVDNLSYDLMSVLAFEDWNKQLYISQCVPTSQQIDFFEKLATEPSLIGAGNKGMAVSAFKKLLLDLVSCAISKGHLGDRTGSRLASKANVQNLQKAGHDHINGLSTLLEKKALSFDKMAHAIRLLKQDAAEVGAQGLETVCDDFLELCEQNNERECTKLLPKIQQEYIDICNQLDSIIELQELICLLESEPPKWMDK